MRIVRGFATARDTLFQRPPLDTYPLPPSLRQRIKQAFGQELTPIQVVERIIIDVRDQGDQALRDYTRRLDSVEVEALEVIPWEKQAARGKVAAELVSALELAAERIRRFHIKHRPTSSVDLSEGLGRLVRPLDRVGLYAPGGAAAYPSTVLMTAIPARVAGVGEVILSTPPGARGEVPASLLVAAELAGVDRIFKVGGAQAIAALAWGTETVPRVDKVCGPGNLFVMLAKKLLYGVVAVDGLYGPTETIILADEAADPALCAADLLAQAEHDPLASALLVTPSPLLAEKVAKEVGGQLASLERRVIAAEALENRGGIAVVDSLEEALELVNLYAPEHLCLLVKNPWSWLSQIRHAGGIFLGESSPEAVGDYTAGPSHVMPTGGSARFGSPLGVEDFVKISSLVALDEAMLKKIGPAAAAIARAEGLTAHARAVEKRLKEKSQP